MAIDRRFDQTFADLLLGSYARLLGRPLLDAAAGEQPTAAWLYRAPFCLLAHDGAADPIFIYANAAAQRCFGYGWDAFLTLPSRLSAETPARDERQRALDAVARDGFITNYSGIRIAKSGRRFRIENAVVWTLRDDDSALGQAAMIRSWRDL